MKALVLETYNTDYQLKDIEKPVAGNGQVLVRIVASGVNPLDLKIKSGSAAHAQQSLPAVLGVDMSGVIETIGRGVTGFKSGDEVYGLVGGIGGLQGTLAEYIAVDARLIALKPENISFREAASLPLALITAWEGLIDRANIRPDQKVLIQGGAGGVGHIAVQLAKAYGSDVYATVASNDADLIYSYNATPIDYNTDVENDCIKFTGSEGFDVIFDTIGGKILEQSFKMVKRYTGHVVSILGWGEHNLAQLSFRGATYSGVFTLHPLISGKGRSHHGQILKKASVLIEMNKIRPRIAIQSYKLETIETAYRAMSANVSREKIVISI